MISSIVAPNITEARNLLATSMSRTPNLSHVQALLIGEEVARSGTGDIVSSIMRFREYRGGMFMVVVRGKSEDFLTSTKPKLELLPSKFFEAFGKSSEQVGYYLRVEVHDLYLRLKNPGGSAYATYVGINPLTGEDTPLDTKMPNDKAKGYLPKDIPRAGTENPTEFAGTVVFNGDKMVGAIDTSETRILAMLHNDLPRGVFTLDDPLEPQHEVSLNMRNGSSPKIDVDLIDGREVIKINVFLEGEITGIPSGINYEKPEYRELLEAAISDVVTQEIQGLIRHTQELGSDVVGFGYELRSHFATYRELRETNLAELYKTASVDVKVTTKLRRTGLMWKTSPYALTATSE